MPSSEATGTEVIQRLLAGSRSQKKGSRPSSSAGAPGPEAAVQPPYHYVLHASPARFANAVEQLYKHWSCVDRPKHAPSVMSAGEVFVWIDGFPGLQREGGRRSSGGGDGTTAAQAELSDLRAAVAGATSVLLVLDDEEAPLSQLRCLYGVWLAGACRRPLRVLAHNLDWEDQCQAIASLDIPAAEHSDIPPPLRERMLAALLGDAAAAATTVDGSPAGPSRALRDALAACVLAEVKPMEQSNLYRERRETRHDHAADHALQSRPGSALSGPSSAHMNAGGSNHYRATANISAIDRAARLLETLDRGVEAEALFRRVLAETEAALGPEHVDTLTAAANLASLLEEHGKTGEAEPLLRRVLAGYERVHGLRHAETAAAGEALGLLLEQQDRQVEAEGAFRIALAGYEASLGPDARETLDAVGHLADALRLRGCLAEAEALSRRALAGYEAAFGPDHHDTLGAVNNLAVLLKGAGQLEAAEPLYRRALAGCEELLGPDAPETLTAAANLAALLQAQGRLEEAEPLLRRALAGREEALGPHDPDTLGAANNLAVLLQAQGQHDAAEPLFRRAMEGWESCFGPDHTDTLTACYNLGVVLETLDRPGPALELYQREAAGRGRRGEAARVEQRQERIAALRARLVPVST